jgi:hypothetical protein
VATLVACSGAWAKIDGPYWETLGECSGLYLAGLADRKHAESDFDGFSRIGDAVGAARKKLDSDDAFLAGVYFGREQSNTQSFYIVELKYHPGSDGEAHRLKSIIDKGCERL